MRIYVKMKKRGGNKYAINKTINIILFSLLEWLARARESLERGWREDILIAEHPTTITPPSIIRSERYLVMLFSSMLCTFSPEGFSILVPVWEISREENIWKNTLLDSVLCYLFSPSTTVGLGYNLDMLFS